MKVKVNVTLADGEGTRYESGQVYDLPDDERTAGWLENGFIEHDTEGDKPKKSGKKKAAKKAKDSVDDAKGDPPNGDDEDPEEDDDDSDAADGNPAPAELRGAALDEALGSANLPKSGTVAEKQARLAEHAAGAGSDNAEEDDMDEKSDEPKDEAVKAAETKAKKATATRRASRTTEKG